VSMRLRTRMAAALAAERTHFLWILVLALLWYVAFAMAARLTLVPAHAPALPMPLWMPIAAALVAAGVLLRRLRAG